MNDILIDYDLHQVYDAIDLYKNATYKVKEADIETEAELLLKMGKIFFLILKVPTHHTHTHFRDNIYILNYLHFVST